MEIFWRLVLGHLIGDFTLQTNKIAAWKRDNIWGMLLHCGIHPIVYSLLLWNYMGQVWVVVGPIALTGWVCVTIIFLAHFIEDQWRVWSVVKKDTADNTFFYIWDQFIHYAVLFTMSPAVFGATSKFRILTYPPLEGVVSIAEAQNMGIWERFMTVTTPEPWMFVAIFFVVVTHFTTVSIFFVEKDLFGKDFPNDREKYLGMFERLALAACFLLPGKLWVVTALGWILFISVLKTKNFSGHSWMNFAMGNFAAVFCGFASRHFFYS